MSSKSSSFLSAFSLSLTGRNVRSRSGSVPDFHSGLTEQTKDVLSLFSVTHVLAFRVDQGPSDCMDLFLVLTNPDASQLRVFLEEPRYDAVWEVLRKVCDEHLCRRWLCAEGRVSVSLFGLGMKHNEQREGDTHTRLRYVLVMGLSSRSNAPNSYSKAANEKGLQLAWVS